MIHNLDWSKPTSLIHAPRAAQFGDGYRQVSGPTIASGTAQEMLDRLRAMGSVDARDVYMCQETGNPMTLAEVEAQLERER